MIIYLDTNIYCRPFDDQDQIIIAQETEAFAEIYDKIGDRSLSLIASNILRYEVSLITDIEIRNEILSIITSASIYVKVERQNKALIDQLINEAELKTQDAAHLVAASLGNADVFITCDKGILNKKDKIQKISDFQKMMIINPVDFKERF